MKINHPYFDAFYVHNGKYKYVFVFTKPAYKEPSEVQIANYNLAKKIVESLDGTMNLSEFQIGGKNEPLTKAEIRNIFKTIRYYYPNIKIKDRWNGEGHYSISIGADSLGNIC